MKSTSPFPKAKASLLVFTILMLFQTSGCQQVNQIDPNATATTTTYPILGLWIGTYTVTVADPTYIGQSFFFSFTIFQDGTLTYKSKTPGYDEYAYGTWSLNGNAFSFAVKTLNYTTGSFSHNQYGTAIYDATHGTLTSGTITDAATGGKSTWTMKREK